MCFKIDWVKLFSVEFKYFSISSGTGFNTNGAVLGKKIKRFVLIEGCDKVTSFLTKTESKIFQSIFK